MELLNFSVVLIAKNESATIRRLISSLGEFLKRGGEVVVLDTGSTDGTAEIADDLGCSVYKVGDKYLQTIDRVLAKAINGRFVVDGEKSIVAEGDRYFDFAGARNECAAFATNDWVCYADADEVFTKLDIDKIEEIIKDKNLANLEYEFIFAHKPDGSPGLTFRQSKFYHRKKLKWTNITHEVLAPITGGVPKYLTSDIFLLEHFQIPGDRHSYLTGLAVDCYQNPHNDRNAHYTARELMWSGRLKSAIKLFEKHVDMNKWPQERAQSEIFIGDCYGKLNHPSVQINHYHKAFQIDSSRRESLLRIANYYKHNNNPQATACFAAAALEIPRSDHYANDVSEYEDVPHALLYWARGWIGDVKGSQEHLLKALSYQPLHPDYLRDTKYYFEYPDNGIQGWMQFDELQFLYDTAKHIGSTGGTIVEVGSWQGRSTHALLTGCKLGRVFSVDTWEGSTDVRDATNGLAKSMDVFEIFKSNMKSFNNIHIVRDSSVNGAKSFSDGSVDMVFIDAGHDFNSVVEDIRAWKGKTEFLCGHDFDPVRWPEVCAAVRQELGEPDEIHNTIWVKHIKDVYKKGFRYA